ncbi:beta family protein [Streptomyces triculaminicus]|uniref:Beta family protein n=1 Tax=Streptomyces triculaminicus TaxID=2816232 RepID=A0A939FRE4_9ACTN|nr:beta family protein [Streptomyces triculaminicus]MBO0655489.1 beta family protein [Streptomyces triculaminicus]
MSGPLYVPVLQARPHAAEAYRQLSPAVQRAVVPLWSFLPRTGLSLDALTAHLQREAHALNKVQRHYPAWVDMPVADETQLAALAGVLSDLGALTLLRPVTGPRRTEHQQSSAFEAARRSGRGLGIRVALSGEWDGATTPLVRDLLDRAGLAVETDLLLDLGAVRADRTDAVKEALRALDALIPLTQWRTAAVLSGGFPEVTAEMLEQGLRSEPRTDWQCWCGVTDSGRSYVPSVSYGDYGIQPTRAFTREPSAGRGGPPWGVLRYTIEESFVLGKMLARGDDRAAANRAMARKILELPEFRGAMASSGESWLRDCARGHGGAAGTGNATVWLRVGNVQHMSYVVRSLLV